MANIFGRFWEFLSRSDHHDPSLARPVSNDPDMHPLGAGNKPPFGGSSSNWKPGQTPPQPPHPISIGHPGPPPQHAPSEHLVQPAHDPDTHPLGVAPLGHRGDLPFHESDLSHQTGEITPHSDQPKAGGVTDPIEHIGNPLGHIEKPNDLIGLGSDPTERTRKL